MMIACPAGPTRPTKPTRPARPTGRGERGAELVEFALVLPVLLLLGLGICDFGLLFQRLEVVTNAAREGARAGAVGLEEGEIEAVVDAYLEAGGLSADPIVTIEFPTIGASPPLPAVRVTVGYPNGSFIVGPIASLFDASLSAITLQSAATMRLEVPAS